ncbi:cupin domain-containing protein [soil metagenome]
MDTSIIEDLGLVPHPEGGFYRQTWASQVPVTLPGELTRPTATLIYFYLPAGVSSAWHKLGSDETWLAHRGRVHLEYGGTGEAPSPTHRVVVGLDLPAGEQPQALVPAAVWQRTVPTDADALVSCLVSPGFDFEDFELA